MIRGQGRAARALLALGVAGLVFLGTPSAHPVAQSKVWVDGREFKLSRAETVGGALERAHVVPRDGVLRSAVTDRVLDDHADPASLWIDGRPATRASRVRPGDRIGVLDGRDRVEPMFLRIDPVAAGTGLPDVERDLWTPGAPGTRADVVGEHSGEAAPGAVLRKPVDAARVPGNVIALSFDDGPDPRYTPRVLDILRDAGVHATFCVIGYQARAHPELLQRIHAEGSTVCDHTEHHPHLDQIAPAAVDSELTSPAAFIQQVTGVAPSFMRPPYGGVNGTVVDAAHRHGMRVLGWSVDPSDYARPAPLVIAGRVLAAAHPGAVVLMHDGGGDRTNTIAALPLVIAALKAKGYTIVTPTP